MTDSNTLDTISADGVAFVKEVEQLGRRLNRVRDGVGRIIFGQKEVVDQTLVTVLAGGHALLIGVPGLAKTRLVETLGTILGLDDNRIQCTPDLMPSDILGSEVLEEGADGKRGFRFIKGPVFAQLLMADEINRASPRTQSALLQAMQEHTVSIAGQTLPLPEPFHVLATQNPLEQEGTYPLPEAQLDRFLLQVSVGYPDQDAERTMLLATTGTDEAEAEPVLTSEELIAAQRLLRRIPVGENVVDAILGCPQRPARRQRYRGGPSACGVGSRPARQSGADAGNPRPRGTGRPLGAVDRRCAGARPPGAAPPHGP